MHTRQTLIRSPLFCVCFARPWHGFFARCQEFCLSYFSALLRGSFSFIFSRSSSSIQWHVVNSESDCGLWFHDLCFVLKWPAPLQWTAKFIKIAGTPTIMYGFSGCDYLISFEWSVWIQRYWLWVFCLVFVVIYCGILRVIYRETDRQRWLLIPKHNVDKS